MTAQIVESPTSTDPDLPPGGGAAKPCRDCGGLGIVFDHSSPDPQRWWDRTCRRCDETGQIRPEVAA